MEQKETTKKGGRRREAKKANGQNRNACYYTPHHTTHIMPGPTPGMLGRGPQPAHLHVVAELVLVELKGIEFLIPPVMQPMLPPQGLGEGDGGRAAGGRGWGCGGA